MRVSGAHSCGDRDTVASVPVGMTSDHFATLETFRNALEAFIRGRLEDVNNGFAVTPILQFHPEHRTFLKSVFAYRSPRENAIRDVLTAVGESLGVNCRVKFVRGSTHAQRTFQIESISWDRTTTTVA